MKGTKEMKSFVPFKEEKSETSILKFIPIFLIAFDHKVPVALNVFLMDQYGCDVFLYQQFGV